MADQTVKEANKSNSQQAKSSAPSNTPGSANIDGAQTRDILKQQRDQSNVQGVVQQQMFRALFGTPTSPGNPQRTNLSNAPTRLRPRTTSKERDDKRRHSPAQNATADEVRELTAIRSANRLVSQNANAGLNRRAAGNGVNLTAPASQPIDGSASQETGVGEGIGDGIQQSLAGTDNAAEQRATEKRYNGSSNEPQTSAEALDSINLGTSSETQKLLDVVGPEAILTFREKLQQVWVSLDESATNDLDVIARMPATLSGQTAVELLMVESPQGIHFVAFLRNKNDFDVLATFDRRALLPDSPSRQLIEAGILAYEQLDGVFIEGSQRIEDKVKELAQNRQQNDIVFNELQRMMVQEKRRRRKFKQMIDFLVDTLDDLDLDGDPGDAPFVPTGNKDKEYENSGRGQLEVEAEEETAPPELQGEDAFFSDPLSSDEAEPDFMKTRA